MLLRTGHRAKGLIGFAIIAVAFALAAARDKTIRMMGVDGEREQCEAFLRARQLLVFLKHLIHHRVIVVAPVITIAGIGDATFQLLRAIHIGRIKAMRQQESVFTGEA